MASSGPRRIYEPSPKHKWPKGFGSPCPEEMPLADAQALLDKAVENPQDQGDALWAVAGDWCFAARPTRIEEGVWHGYPVIGSEVPERVLKELEVAGHIDRRQRQRLRLQKSLPERWP